MKCLVLVDKFFGPRILYVGYREVASKQAGNGRSCAQKGARQTVPFCYYLNIHIAVQIYDLQGGIHGTALRF
jgi:hypothetical protein